MASLSSSSSSASFEPYTVTLPTAATESVSPIVFTIRSLRNEEDVKSWSEFCAFCFSYKANPPSSSYFARHFHNDPQRDLDLVRVATVTIPDEEEQLSAAGILTFQEEEEETTKIRREQIVASVRIFRRSVSLGEDGDSVKAGGIGEVCTHVDYRKRGLANCLLQDAVRIMSLETTDMATSLLHAAPQLHPVYQRAANYQPVTTPWSLLSVTKSQLVTAAKTPTCTKTLVRVAQFPEDTPQLYALHQTYSERRFCGCIIRSAAYWNDYLSHELADSLLVCVDETTRGIVGWISLRFRGGRYQVREFGRDLTTSTTTAVLGILLQASLEKLLDEKNSAQDATTDVMTVAIPTPVWEELQAEQQGDTAKFWKDTNEPERDDDVGWMYRAVSSSPGNQTTSPSMVDLVRTRGRPHVIWPSDSF